MYFMLLFALISNTALPNEPAPGVAKKAEEVKPDTTQQKPKGWLGIFFDSIFDSDEAETDTSTEITQPDGNPADEVYRTSQNPDTTQPRYPPKDGIRIGCICMDNTAQDDVGRGACSGRGGVRYWLYKLPDKTEPVYFATERHHNHPQDLTPTELQRLDAHNPYRKPKPDADSNALMPIIPMGGVLQLLTVIILCTTVITIVRQILQKRR